ncbi:hypothetical protein PENSPDRAFT_61842 [Peniophora sp. CONT]|nr:hypothetical protein PENSPDRAFT_61842 [Peniophora sp. CONT]
MHQLNDLPVELLELVFKIVADVWPLAVWLKDDKCSAYHQRNTSCTKCVEARLRSLTRRLGWVNLTFVCSHWRNMIIRRTSFWTDIQEPMTLDCVQAFVQRSRDQGLTVSDIHRPVALLSFDDDDNEIISVAQPLVLLHTLRTAHNRISCLTAHSSAIYNLAHEIKRRPLSSLKTLSVIINVDDLAEPPAAIETDGDVLALLGPCLFKELSMTSCIYLTDWASSVFTSLHSLTLREISAPSGVLTSVFACIRSLEHLGRLEISNQRDLNPDNTLELQSQTPVFLRHCKELEIEGERGFMTALLNILRVPFTALVKIRGTFNQTYPSPKSSGTLFTEVSRENYIVNDENSTEEVAWVSFHHGRRITAAPAALLSGQMSLHLSHRQSAFERAVPLDAGYDRQLQFRWTTDICNGYNEEAFLEDCTTAFRAAPSTAQHVRDLRFPVRTDPTSITPAILRRCFASWTCVERIYAAGTISAHCLVNALGPSPHDTTPLFPRLTELVLVDAHFDEDGMGGMGALGAQIVGMLIERKDAGVALEVLRLSDVELLRRETMWWDLISGMVSVRSMSQ